MQTGYFVISGKNCFEPVNTYIKEDYKVDYEKPLLDGMLYGAEDYSFLTNSNLMVVITVEKVDNSNDECEIEIIAGGGGSGIFSITAGTEERRVVKFYNKIVDFCNTNGYEISKLEEQ